jgi:hypothetical protein
MLSYYFLTAKFLLLTGQTHLKVGITLSSIYTHRLTITFIEG